MDNIHEIKDFILSKTRDNAIKFGDKLPTTTNKGKYSFNEIGGWEGGFWTGINYLCYELSEDKFFLEAARASRHRFADRLFKKPETLDHDIGFLYILSCVADYKITGDEEAKKIALGAVEELAKRFNQAGNFIKAWNTWDESDAFNVENRGRIIIDCMYNLPILFWASEVTGNEKYKKIAVAHADTCAKYIIREDYTTFHTYVFDPVTGAPKYGRTHQGYSDESCWSRGQAWTIGGYTYAYAYTGDPRYLEIAKKCTKVFIDRVEEDYIPMWDFDVPDKNAEPRDTSAASIMIASILELSKYVNEEESKYYIAYAEKTLESLYINYSSRNLLEEEGLLLHATGHKPNNNNVDVSLIYGDYYFVEAVARLLNKTVRYW